MISIRKSLGLLVEVMTVRGWEAEVVFGGGKRIIEYCCGLDFSWEMSNFGLLD